MTIIEKPTELIISENDTNTRLDVILPRLVPLYSRSFFQKLIKSGKIRLNGEVNKKVKTNILQDHIINIEWPVEKNFEIKSEEFIYDILYEDNDLIVIDKPPGVVVHPAAGNWEGTIVNALLGKDSSFLDNFTEDEEDLNLNRPGIVHRLDKDTSGCLIVAKNSLSRQKLSESFADRKVIKTYFALSCGNPLRNNYEIKTLIGRHKINRQKMSVVTKNGKEAVTICKVIERGDIGKDKIALMKINILTGRTHQIRVHLSHIKLPVLGDSVYGGNQNIPCPRQMLHAGEITFPHPITNKPISVISPYPKDFQDFLDSI